MKKNNLLVILITLFTVLIFSSCSKSSDEPIEDKPKFHRISVTMGLSNNKDLTKVMNISYKAEGEGIDTEGIALGTTCTSGFAIKTEPTESKPVTFKVTVNSNIKPNSTYDKEVIDAILTFEGNLKVYFDDDSTAASTEIQNNIIHLEGIDYNNENIQHLIDISFPAVYVYTISKEGDQYKVSIKPEI